MAVDESAEASFLRDVRWLFRIEDRDAMAYSFDLWDFEDVLANAADILERIEDGTMPCDITWNPEDVARLRQWIAEYG
jgi:hypothetical protein